MIDTRHPELKCKFEPRGCDCDGKTLCSFCGWNPAEKARRVAALRAKAERGEPLHLNVLKRSNGCAIGYSFTCEECNTTECIMRKVV